jgi:bifunctional non-homologous end joining protein LigD
MNKAERKNKVFVDWSQNAHSKTTIGVYSLRAKPTPTVSTPVTWTEVEEAAEGNPLSFTAQDVLERVDTLGDLFAPTLELKQSLPTGTG